MRELIAYIHEHHNGNQSEFARSQGVSEVQARRWIKRGCVVINGAVFCPISKRVSK